MKGLTVYSYYCLDILHIGHLIHMQKGKEFGGTHIVGILSDKVIEKKKGKKPIIPLNERLMIAKNIKFNDSAIVQNKYSPIDNITTLNPDFLLESISHGIKYIKQIKKEIKKRGLKTKVITCCYYDEQSSTKIKKLIRSK